ncbi:ATP-binding protein [Tyzzerella sp. OttesenSCG-928-J15]|nr:ATP-binding protein [Tyzzerella sp. OttesenSCG-928-J15]
MADNLTLHFVVPGDDFSRAGEASSNIKKTLKQLGFPPSIIRKVAISLYEGEINMVIHAGGGEIDAVVCPDKIELTLADKGPGIADIELAFQEGYSTATEDVRDLGFGAGMGLPNMREYTDYIEIESVLGEGTTVRLIILNK